MSEENYIPTDSVLSKLHKSDNNYAELKKAYDELKNAYDETDKKYKSLVDSYCELVCRTIAPANEKEPLAQWNDEQYWESLNYIRTEHSWDDFQISALKITGIADKETELPIPFAIPASHPNGAVVEIDAHAFSKDNRLVSIVLPDSICRIGSSAFQSCNNLRSVTILGNVGIISSYAFSQCSQLENVYLSNGISVIGHSAFECCSALTSIIIPKSVQRICPFAFYNCENLRHIVILNPDIDIELTAFYNCPNVKIITIPMALANNIDSIFDNSDDIEEVNWVEQTFDFGIEKSLDIILTEITEDEFSSGKTGRTVYFNIVNQNAAPVKLSVNDVFIIQNNQILSCDTWLSDGVVSKEIIFPQCCCLAASVFFDDNFPDFYFDVGSVIGLSLSINQNEIDEDEEEWKHEVFTTDGHGDFEEILDLPSSKNYCVIFRNTTRGWVLVASNVPEQNNTPASYEIDFATFVVRTNTFSCNLNHEVETVQAFVSIMAADGSVFKASTIAGYCRHCNFYFLLEKDFRILQQKGKLLCQLLSREEYDKKGNAIFSGEDMKAESVLRRCGYTVNATDNLSSKQRQKILSLVLDNQLYTATELCGFLDWLISYHGRSKTRNMSSAISKWSEDRQFVQSYNTSNRRKIGIKGIQY